MELVTVKDLKALIADMDDDAEVYVASGEDTFTATAVKQDDDGDLIIETVFYCS